MALPDVLLIGDSISGGYMKPVTAALQGKANVARSEVNFGNTERGVSRLDKWPDDTDWAVIHFNFGLHDLCYRREFPDASDVRDKVNGKQTVPPVTDRQNFTTLVERLEATGAQFILTTTTVGPRGEEGRLWSTT